MPKKGNTVATVKAIVEPIINDLGLELWDVRFLKEGASWYLRIFIDSPNGITIDDCEKVSRAIDTPLDEQDPISQAYCLEVCSPGLERELITEEHYNKFIGSDIKVKLIRPIEGIGRELSGVLKSSDKDSFEIADDDDQRLTILKKDTVWVKLDDFDF